MPKNTTIPGAKPMPDLEAERRMEAHCLQYLHAGYTIRKNAVPADLLARLQVKFDQHTEAIIEERGAAWRNYGKRFQIDELQEDEAFRELGTLPALQPLIHSIAGAVWRKPPKFTNVYGSVHFGHEASNQSWHNDARYPDREGIPFTPFLIRGSVLMDEVTEDMGPTVLLPGSQGTHFSPPDWVHAEDRQPYKMPGMVRFTGQAGDILLNDTSVWHANTPNLTDRARKLAWLIWQPGV